MTFDVGLIEILSDELVVLRWFGHTRSDTDGMWVRAKVRKPTKCAVTDRPIKPGEYAFRPVGNQDYRGRRIAPEMIDALLDDARQKA